MFETRRQNALARPACLAFAAAALLSSPLSPVPGLAPSRAVAEQSGIAHQSSVELWLAQAEATPGEPEAGSEPESQAGSDEGESVVEDADESGEAAPDTEAGEDDGLPGRKTIRRKFKLAQRLAAMEVAVGIRGEQLDAWRDFTDALIASVPDYDRPGRRGGPRGEGRGDGDGKGRAGPQAKADMKPMDGIRRMAERMVERGAKAVTLLNALDALKAKLSEEQLERFGQFERMLMHRGKAGRRHGKGARGAGRHGRHHGRHHMHGGHHKRHACPHHGGRDGANGGKGYGGQKHACPHHGKKGAHHGGMRGQGGPDGEGRERRGMHREEMMGRGPGMGRDSGRGPGAGGLPRDDEPADARPAPEAPEQPTQEEHRPDSTGAPEVIKPDVSLPSDATAPPADAKGLRDL